MGGVEGPDFGLLCGGGKEELVGVVLAQQTDHLL